MREVESRGSTAGEMPSSAICPQSTVPASRGGEGEKKERGRGGGGGKIERFFSQPFTVAEVFTGSKGKYVSLKDTIRGFKMIVDGECDSLPEQAFYMVGGIDEVFEKAKKMGAAA